MSNEMSQDDDLLQEFLTESDEMLQNVEQDLLGLEDSGDSEILNRIFRGVHTIKGTSSFLGFDQIVELTHHGEDLLNIMRRGELAVSRRIIDVLLSVTDQLKLMLDDVRGHRSDEYDLTPWLRQIDECRAGRKPGDAAAPVVAAPAPVVETHEPTQWEVEASARAAEAVAAHEADAKAAAEIVEVEEIVDLPGEPPMLGRDADFEALDNELSVADAVVKAKAAAEADQSVVDAKLVEMTEEEVDNAEELAAEAAAKAAEDAEIAAAVAAVVAEPLAPPTQAPPVAEIAAEVAAVAPPPVAVEAAPAPEPAKVEAKAPAPSVPERRPAQKKGNEEEIAGSTMRVDVRKLDFLVNLVGELVLERNRLLQISRDMSNGRLDHEQSSSVLQQSTARLSFITDELQNASLNTRMVPIDVVFKKIPRLVRDLCGSLNKLVDLRIEGKETEIDKTMTEYINDPMVHIIRNSLDHGLESSAERLAAGKSEAGSIVVGARQEGDQIIVSIVDDGRGIDPEKIRKKAVEKGLVSAEASRALSKRDLLDMIFQPGFSTKEVTTSVSGRGVGMDVVRTNLKKLNGTVEVDSQVGKGTTVLLRVPLTMAILPVLLASVSDEVYGIPLRSVVEILRVQPKTIHTVEGHEVLSLRDRTLPLVRLSDVLEVPGPTAQGEMLRVVILATGDQRFALLVDSLLGQESTVIKPMEQLLRDCNSIAGATISGDGRVRLVLDPAGLVASAESFTGVH